jgi:serine/threonine protein kinase
MPPPSPRPTSSPAADGVPLDLLLTGLTESGILPPAEVQALKGRATPADRQNCVPLAKELVKARKLTKYQATAILQGKGRDLTLDNYVILDKLGEGGMGMVFKARHRKLGQVVALKVLSASVTSKPTAVKRFLREVRAVSQLQHPNIVAASDAGEDKGTHFLVMECVEGTDLSKLVKQQGPLPAERAVDCIVQAARGLAHAHAAGIIHRDIKPSNLLLDSKGTIKLLDLGLARQATEDDDSATQELTKTGAILGTCDYIAPEQALNSKNADQRSDVYSLGCTLYYLLAGTTMYGGQTMMEKLMAHRDMPIPPLPGAAPALQAVYRRMVAKKPEERFASMNEASAALEASQRPGATTPRAAGSWRRPLLLGTAAAALLGTGLLLVLLFVLFGSGTRPTEAAGGGPTGGTTTSKASSPALTGAVDDPARWRNAINLLALADPAKDKNTGTWKLENGNLVCDAVPGAKLLLPYQPPEEYDVRVEYTRLTGRHSVMIVLSNAGRLFGWEMGDGIFGFNTVDGKARYAGSGPGKPGLVNGQRTTTIVQVRKQGLKAYTNGTLYSELTTDYQNLGPPEYWNWWSGGSLGVGSWSGAASFHRIEVLEITGKGTSKRLEGAAVQDKPVDAIHDPVRWQKAVNLLRLIDPARDATAGQWKKSDLGVTSDRSLAAKLVIPYQPPEEYDFRIVFTRHDGDHAVAQMLYKGGRGFAWEMGIHPNKAFGFNMVAGRANNNPTTVAGKDLSNGEKHTSIVQVRNTGLVTYLDGALVKEYKTDYKDFAEPYPWKWNSPTTLGLGSWTSSTTFHAVDVLEVTGKGTLTRP